MIRRPPRSTLFPYTDALPISEAAKTALAEGDSKKMASAIRSAIEAQYSAREAEMDKNANSLIMASIKDRKSTRLNSSHSQISYAVFCLKKKKTSYTSIC